MDVKLFFQAIIKFLSGALFTALMIFIPAGDMHWMNGWLFLGILFIPMFLAGMVMMVKAPIF